MIQIGFDRVEEALGVTEWVAVVSVVVALLSVAHQQYLMRQQNKLEARARQYDRTTALLFKAMDNPDLLEAISGDSKDEQRERRFRQVWINHTMVIFGQRRLFPRAEWNSTVEDIRDFMSSPELRAHWSKYGEFYAPDFREFIDQVIYRPDDGGPTMEPPPQPASMAQESAT